MQPAKLVLLTGLICVALFAGSLANQAKDNKAEVALQAAIKIETVDGNLKGAIEQYKKLAQGANKPVAAQALVQLGGCYEKQGDADARKTYEQVLSKFGDQKDAVAVARARLAALGGPGGAGGLVARRILTDATIAFLKSANSVGPGGEVLTADGKYISHMDRNTGDLVQFEIASGQTRRITNRGPWGNTENNYQYLACSRDGKQIAYNSYAVGWVPQLRIRNLDGSGLRTLYKSKGEKSSWVYPLDWSPDAGSILAGRGYELTLISTADGSVRVLKRITSGSFFVEKGPSFSPDGRFVAFSLVREGSPPHGDVFLMTADGRNEAVVAGHPAEERLLGWTPDGRSLVFLSDRAGTWDIWTVRITRGKQQGEPQLLKKGFDWNFDVLGFAPNGSFYYRTSTLLGRLYNGVVDLETGKVLVPPAPVTTRYASPPYDLSWSPDGRNLAYLSRMGRIGPGNNILTIRSAATGEERFLAPRLRRVRQISWAPDSRAVIAGGLTEAESGIFRIDTETSEITRLADDGQFPMLCPDGKTLVFRGGGGTRKRNLDTGEELEVVKAGSGLHGLSPDGREVVFRTMQGEVKTVSLNGGEPRELFRLRAEYYFLWWTRDGRYVIVQARGANYTASTEIWRVPAQGGTPLKLELSVPQMGSFALHPDNRRFAYSVDEGSKRELWVLENFLPPSKVVK